MAHVSALLRRTERLIRKRQTQYIDFGVRFREFDRIDNGPIEPTGRYSNVYGGRWDRHVTRGDDTVGDYIGEPLSVVTYDVSPVQFEALTDDVSSTILFLGSRGASKTSSLARWLLKMAARWPRKTIPVMVEKRARARKLARKHILPLLLTQWLADSRAPIRMSPEETAIDFATLAQMLFYAASVVDDARGDGSPALGVDELQLCPPEAVNNAKLSVREGSGESQIMETCTALEGWLQEYVDKARELDTHRVMDVSITDNIWFDRVFDQSVGAWVPHVVPEARGVMDEVEFEREIGRWNSIERRFIPQFHALSGIVHYNFDRSTHQQSWDQRHAVLHRMIGCIHPGQGDDITHRIATNRFGRGADYFAGVDWGVKPMVANIWKVLRPAPGMPEIAWCVDEITIEHTDAGPLPMCNEMRKRGYTPSNTIWIADASDQYASSNYTLVRREGYTVTKPSRKGGNPRQRNRVNAVTAKLRNAAGQTTMFIDPRRAPRTAEAFARHKLDDRGKLENSRYGHYTAAGGYVIVKLWPSGTDAERVLAIHA